MQEARKVGSSERELPQGGGLDPCHGQIVERAREGARESGGAGDGAEVREVFVLPGVEGGACGDGLRANEGGRCDSSSRQDRGREARGELREAEPMETGRCPRGQRDRPGHVISRAAGG